MRLAACLVLLFGLLLAAAPATAAPEPLLGGREGCIVVSDACGRLLYVEGLDTARTRFRPCSTFKIPNTLIMLDSGVAADLNHPLPWDSVKYPRREDRPAAWYQDQTLKTAFTRSVVWAYQELAAQVGEQRMQCYVDPFDYGNRNIAGGAALPFWLEGDLKISAIEQVAFLRRMWNGDLGVSAAATRATLDVMVVERGDGWVLRGKSGLGEVGDGRLRIGWYVGSLQRGDAVWYFAVNLLDEQWQPVMDGRLPLVHSALQRLGLLDH